MLGEVFAVLTRRRGWAAQDARAIVTTFIELLPVTASTPATLIRAMTLSEQHGISFWDAQIAAVAAEGGCSLLLSEDLQDGRTFSVADVGRTLTVVNPFNDANLSTLEAAGFPGG